MNELVVFDTNVFVSYLLPPKERLTAVKIVVNKILDGTAVPVYSDATMAEYVAVLGRTKFHFSHEEVFELLSLIRDKGIYVEPIPLLLPFSDTSDKCFYDAAQAAISWLVTGNKKHFPNEPFIVSPYEYLEHTRH